jgi:hypothetical protein
MVNPLGEFYEINPFRDFFLVLPAKSLYRRATMDILFATSDLEVVATSQSALAKVYGASGHVACRRLCELASMESLAVAAAFPTHQLTPLAEPSCYSVSVSPTHKIFFEAILNSEARASTRDLKLNSVTAIRIYAWGKL